MDCRNLRRWEGRMPQAAENQKRTACVPAHRRFDRIVKLHIRVTVSSQIAPRVVSHAPANHRAARTRSIRGTNFAHSGGRPLFWRSITESAFEGAAGVGQRFGRRSITPKGHDTTQYPQPLQTSFCTSTDPTSVRTIARWDTPRGSRLLLAMLANV